ncbi:zinc finger, CCHC-type containing protein [Tanacetum coccineum]
MTGMMNSIIGGKVDLVLCGLKLVEADGVAEDRIGAGVNDNVVIRRTPEIKQLTKAFDERPMTQLLIILNSVWFSGIMVVSLEKAYHMDAKVSSMGRGSRLGGTAMAEEDAFLVDDFEGGLCVDYTDAEIGHILNGMSESLFDVYQNVESAKELWDSLESKYMAENASSNKFLDSLRAQDSDKGKGKEVDGPSVNMTEEGKNKNNKQNKGKKPGFKENNSGFGSNRKPKLECWKCGKTDHFKRDYRSGNKKNANAGGSGKGSKDQSQDQEGSVLYMGDDHFAPVYGKGSVVLEFSLGKYITLFNVLYVPKLCKNFISGPVLNKCGYKQVLNKVPDDSGSAYMSSSTVVISLLWHARLGHVYYKRMLEMSKNDLIPAIDENLKQYEALDKFRIYITEVELQQNDLIKTLRIDRGGEYYDPVFFQSVGIIHETTAPYTPQQNDMAERKNRALKEMVNSMLSYSGLSEGFWGEALAVVRLPDPKRKTLGEKGIDCIFVGYTKHSKAYRFYVIEPNDSVSINSVIESRDAIFDENRFSSIPRPKDIIPNSDESQMDDHSNDVPSETPEPRSGYKPLGCKWIFKSKMKVGGTIDKFKAQLVIQGFRQKEGIDYFDTYALVARITTIRLLLALAAIHNLAMVI